MGKRIKRSDRYVIDSNGDEVDRMELASGAGYSLVSSDGTSIKDFERQFGKPADSTTMHACLGWWTKLGNVANTVLNDKADPGTTDDAALAITEHVELTEKGIWVEKTEAVARGPKYDKDIMAGALLAILTASNKAQGDLANYRARLDDKAYAAKVRARTDVMAQYYKDLEAKKAESKPQADLDEVA
jgi:hypothetical protein